MPGVTINPAVPDRELLDNEIARLRGLDVGDLRARWCPSLRLPGRVVPSVPDTRLAKPLAAVRFTQTTKKKAPLERGCCRRAISPVRPL
jgi:hypothetical protein